MEVLTTWWPITSIPEMRQKEPSHFCNNIKAYLQYLRGPIQIDREFFRSHSRYPALGVEKNTKRGEAQEPAFWLNASRGGKIKNPIGNRKLNKSEIGIFFISVGKKAVWRRFSYIKIKIIHKKKLFLQKVVKIMVISKSVLIKSLADMPDKFSIDELLDKLLLIQKIEIGLEQSDKNQGISLEESKKRLERWLK
jgi:hypothetical protein